MTERGTTSVSVRDKLLNAAEGLMLSRGYVATGIGAICSEAGVTKGSFFHYFASKEELGKELLVRFAGRQGAAFAEVCSSIKDPLDRVYGILECALQASQDPAMKGCLVGTFAQEISETHPALRAVCDDCFQKFLDGMAEDLVTAKERHCPDAEFDAASLSTCFLSIMQGSILLWRTSGDRSAMARNLAHFRGYVRSLYGR